MGSFHFFTETQTPLQTDVCATLIKNLPKNKNIKTQTSPFRYPGGKSKLTKFIATLINQEHAETLISPYTGGGSVEFALLQAGLIQNLIINDLDYFVYNVYYVILNHYDEFIQQLNHIKINHQVYGWAHNVINHKQAENDRIKQALAMLINNRCSYSGIYYAGPIGGKNGNNATLAIRFKPDNIIKRCQAIHHCKDRITLYHCDALQLIKQEQLTPNSTFLIDPPYVEKGPKLYQMSYHKSDHIALISQLKQLHQNSDNDIILFYDNNQLITNELNIQPHVLIRKFSI